MLECFVWRWYKEFCFIDSETEDLSKSNGDGFYISLDNVTNKIVSLNTIHYGTQRSADTI